MPKLRGCIARFGRCSTTPYARARPSCPMARQSRTATFRTVTAGPDRRVHGAKRSFRRSGSAGGGRISARNARRPHSLPELPEVEITARRLRQRIIGLQILRIGGVDWPRMLPNSTEAELQTVLPGLTVNVIDRRGKYLLVGFDEDQWLVVHRKMSGNVLLRPGNALPEAHTHLEIEF